MKHITHPPDAQAPSLALTASLLKAARALLNISAEELADLAQVGVATIRRAESTPGAARMNEETATRLLDCLDRLGIEFIPADETGGEGVRFRSPRR